MKKSANKKPLTSSFNSFSDLKKVKKQMAEHAQKQKEKRQLELIEKKQAQAEVNLFRHAVGDVIPLKSHNRKSIDIPKPQPLPIKRQEDDREVMLASLSDEFDVESLLDTDEALSYRSVGIAVATVKKLRRGHWRIQDELDLHGYRRDGAREALNDFIRESSKLGLRCVRVIHGKGHGSPGKTPVLKARVLSWLMQKKEVLAYTQARGPDGGAGALIVLLDASPLKAHNMPPSTPTY